LGNGKNGGQCDEKDKISGGIMHGLHIIKAVARGRPDEKEGTADVAQQSGDESEDEQQQSAAHRKSVQFAQKEADEKCCLQRSDSATGFIDADEPGTDLNDISLLNCRNAQEPNRFNC
jgi:hypothetical protein